jgi:hypothetical protein
MAMKTFFRIMGRPSETLRRDNEADLGSRQLNSKGSCRKIGAHHPCVSISPDQLRAAAIVPQRDLRAKDIPFRIDILYITY